MEPVLGWELLTHRNNQLGAVHKSETEKCNGDPVVVCGSQALMKYKKLVTHWNEDETFFYGHVTVQLPTVRFLSSSTEA